MNELDIGEVRQRTGLQASALRYYEQRGLIQSTGRNGLRRRYHPEVIRRLALIQVAQAGGFTLAETAELLETTGSDPDFRKRLAAKADELDQRIEILAGIRDQLRHAVNCPSPRLVDCQHFQRYVDAAFESRPLPHALDLPPSYRR